MFSGIHPKTVNFFALNVSISEPVFAMNRIMFPHDPLFSSSERFRRFRIETILKVFCWYIVLI